MNLQPTTPTHLWRQAPWRLLAFVGIALLMGGLVTLVPTLRDSHGLLAALIAGLGFVSLIIINWFTPQDVTRKGPEQDIPASRNRMKRLVHDYREEGLISAGGPRAVFGHGGVETTSLVRLRSSQDRIRFLLGTLETCAEPTHRSQVKTLVGEIQESWDVCFIQHGSSLSRALHTRWTASPQELLLWESDPVVGALLEETFEDLGFQVMRMPTYWLRVVQECSSTQASELVDQTGRFYVEIHRSLPRPTEGSFWEKIRNEMIPLEQLSSSQLLAEEELPVEQREAVLGALTHLFEKALEAARLQRRKPLHSHGR